MAKAADVIVPSPSVSERPPELQKRRALELVIERLDTIDRAERVDVLRAAAAFYGIHLGTEILR